MSAVIDFAGCPEVEAVPGVVWGKWCFKGTRLPLYCLFDTIGELTVEEFCDWYDIEPERVHAVLDYVTAQTEISVFSDEENFRACGVEV